MQTLQANHESVSSTVNVSTLRDQLKQLVTEHADESNWPYHRVWTVLYKSLENHFPELGDIRAEAQKRGIKQIEYVEQAGYLSRAHVLACDIFKKKTAADHLMNSLERIARARQRIDNAIMLFGRNDDRAFLLRRL